MLSQSAKASKVLFGYGFDDRPLMTMPVVTRYADPNGVFEQLLSAASPSATARNLRAILPDLTRAQPLDTQDKLALMAKPDHPAAATIEVIKTPIILHHLAWLAMRAAPSNQAVPLEDLVRYSQIFGGEYITYNSTPGNRLAAVIDPVRAHVAGLHVDNRSKLPLDWRLLSRRRMGCNVGPDTRLMIACFPDVLTMAIELGKGRVAKPDIQTFNSVLNEYVHIYPDRITAIAFRVEPGEAWLFPTDCMGHDGSTTGYGNSSAYLILGHWKRVDPAKPYLPLVCS